MPIDEMSAEANIDALHTDTLRELMPVIVVMAIICVLGTIGNSFTIAFYGFVARKTPTILLISVLACVDLVVCILIMAQITEMVVNVKFTSAVGCKITHFLGHWSIETSGILIWFIAIDRYRHVCYPLEKQVTFTVAKRAAVIIITITLLLSVSGLANFDILEFRPDSSQSNATVVLAHYCTTREDQTYKVSVIFWQSCDILVFVAVLVGICFTYGRIVWVLKTDSNALETDNNHHSGAHNEPSDDTRVDRLTSGASTQDGRHSTTHIAHSKMKTTERSITFMMLVVSVIPCACFWSFFILKVVGFRSHKSVKEPELGLGTQFANRLMYVNSFANPIVYCCFNPQFRRYIQRTILRHKSESLQISTTMPRASHS